MNVPVDLGPAIEVRIGTGEKPRGQPGGEIVMDELVERKGEKHLMNMLGEGRDVEIKSPGLNRVPQPSRRGRDGV